MVNPLRGEVALEVEGETYTLCLDINAIIEVENLLDIGIAEVAGLFSEPGRVRAGYVRAMLWAALQRHHPHIELRMAGDLLVKVGLARVIETLGETLDAAFPSEEGEHRRHPPTTAGTGKVSTSRSSRSGSSRKRSGG
ncbi:GTA-gp10 family protein [Devosia geojensis]|uniref:GTA-gp10 family protein n=1 Tax=Devosia geojensis TaxID=443610 RepID=UPI00069917D7|nr:GTA-gp10 family protein [Devosia geojensis]